MSDSITAPCGAEVTAPTPRERGAAYSAHTSSCADCIAYHERLRERLR